MAKVKNPTDAWGIGALVLGILGILLFLAPYIGIFLSIAAVVFYKIQQKHKITGTATGGLVTGIIGIIINGIMLLFIIGILAFLGAVNSASSDVDINQLDTISEKTNNVKTPSIQPTQSNNKINPNTEYIKSSIKLEDIVVGKGYGQFDVEGFDKKKPTVEGKIRNTGDKILERVDITVYFLDSGGTRIGEKQFSPISFNSIMGDRTPLKPNYVRDWGYAISDAPDGWDNKVEVLISDIIFE